MNKVLVFVCALFLSPLAAADFAGAMVGTVTGLVENAQGAMVSPRATVEATTQVQATPAGVATGATVVGSVSCANGLSVSINFAASYSTATGTITGFYSDVPGSTTLDKPITFTKGSGLTWTASMSGQAPSATGKRAYDLQVEITLPREALFSGTDYPADKSYSGQLDDTRVVEIPVSVPALGYNQTHSLTMTMTGSWSARGVPLPDGSRQITGNVSGTFTSSAPMSLVLNVPGLGQQTVTVAVSGRFGGTLVNNSATEVAFIGAWAASAGDQNYGGDLLITVPLNDVANLKFIPYSYVGSLSVNPGIMGAPNVSVPLNISGSFPFVLN